ncbi:MAG: hypothetical protein MRZ79_08785 [Bacteroidia bacterium]|nr:hypothetical protein [Bacteroidia bacterium]
MRLKILLLLIGSMAGSAAFAQQTGKLSLQLGYQNRIMNDQLSSPLVYSAHSLNVGLNYEKKCKDFLELNLSLAVGTNQPLGMGRREGELQDIPDFEGNREAYEIVLNPWLSYVQAQGNARWGKRTSLGVFGLGMGIQHTYTGMRLDDWHYSQVDIAPFYANEFPLGNNMLEVMAELPLLAWVVRPNYSSDAYLPGNSSYYLTYVRTSSSLVSINQLVNPRLRLTYKLADENRRLAQIGFQASYTSYPSPKPLAMLSSHVFVSFRL